MTAANAHKGWLSCGVITALLLGWGASAATGISLAAEGSPAAGAIVAADRSVAADDWPTFGHDGQRMGSVADSGFSPENAGDLELKWSTQVDNVPLALNSLMAPVVAGKVAMGEASKTVVYIAGSSDTFFALDSEDGKVVWTRTFDSAVVADDDSYYLCPNSVNATPAIDRGGNIVYTIARDGKLYGLDLATGAVKFGPFQFVPAFAKAWSLNFYDGVIYTTTSQGCGGDRSGIYSMNVKDAMHPVVHEFLVRRGFGAGMWSRGGVVISGNRLYTSTGDGNFDPKVGDYGSSFLATTLGDLQLVDHYTPTNAKEINKLDLDMPSGGTVVFPYGKYQLIAGGGKESVVYLLDTNALGGADHHTPLYATAPLANDDSALEQKGMWGAPAVWVDKKSDGKGSEETWLYVTIWGAVAKNLPRFARRNGEVPHGCIMAFKVVSDDKTQTPTLQPAWISPDFNLPDPPVIANGVLFALATGENPQQQHKQGILHYKNKEEWKQNLLTTEQRGMGTHPAELLALDARTGKLLYRSGEAMKSWVHFSGLAVADGRVYAVDHSSRVYSFGIKSFGIKKKQP